MTETLIGQTDWSKGARAAHGGCADGARGRAGGGHQGNPGEGPPRLDKTAFEPLRLIQGRRVAPHENGNNGWRLCENAQQPAIRRIVFSIAYFLIADTVLFFFRLTKLRRTFYVQVECLCFHTAWVESCHSFPTIGWPGCAWVAGVSSLHGYDAPRDLAVRI